MSEVSESVNGASEQSEWKNKPSERPIQNAVLWLETHPTSFPSASTPPFPPSPPEKRAVMVEKVAELFSLISVYIQGRGATLYRPSSPKESWET